ncbi:alpha/beta fold hydrolase [Actinoplanes subtropicus]|uniref:alpha/beta fold hydrolase n=1 Tax=Actinoplanes subtropicus TaxID=543632 RepID=UPI000A011B23|nr:alpha/beta fold hydrolase [Actinoplanes subtropicus]
MTAQIGPTDGLRAPGTTTITVLRGRVRYRDEGHGTPVVLVHGIGRSLEDWIELHNLLRGRGFRVVSVDLAGYGESEPLQVLHDLPALAHFLADFAEAVGIREPAHLVGNSLGGAVAMQLSAQAPERVRSLVLANSAGFGRAVALPIRLMSVRPLGRLLLSRPSLASARRVELSFFHDPALATDDRVHLGYRLALRPHGTRVFLETAGSLGTILGARAAWRRALLAAVVARRVPTLVVWGDDDKIVPFAQLGAAGRYLPYARTHLFPDTGHMPQIERAEEFADLVTGFWAGAGTAAPAAEDRT